MKDKLRIIAPLAILLVLLAIFLVPRYLERQALDNFAAPLFDYALPESATLVQKQSSKDAQGGWTAAMLVESPESQEALQTYYDSVEAAPAKEGYSLTLEVKVLDDESLEVLQQAGAYEEGKQYYFIYLYSAPQN